MSMTFAGAEPLAPSGYGLTDDRFHIREPEPGDRQDQILELLQSTMAGGSERWADRRLWEWKHLKNPFGHSLVLVAEAGDGRIAGLRAFMRWRFCSGGRTLEAFRPVDTATHADFRRMGIFTKLTLRATERARQLGADVIFNTPNNVSVSGYMKMGWTQVGVAMPLLRVRGYPNAVFKMARRGAGRRLGLRPKARSSEATMPAAMRPQKAITPDFERLIEQRRERQKGLIATDSSVPYLLWRYAENPLYSYAVVVEREAGALTGACVVRLARGASLDTLVFEEFFTSEPSRKVVGRLVDHAFDVFKPDFGSAYAPPETEFQQALARSGFRWKSRSRINFVANPLQGGVSPAPGLFSSWAIGMSELEIF
jgi:GNAT superfamily N-acetyltransferase